MRFDKNDLLHIEYLSKKYNETNIPLYISYPVLNRWNMKLDDSTLIDSFKKVQNPFLYFHFPFCKKACYYCMCYKDVGFSEQDKDLYIDYLEKEIIQKMLLLQNENIKNISHMHWGGGTPTYLNNDQIKRMFSIISDNINLKIRPESSISIEAYPDTEVIDFGKLELLRKSGFNEISFGIQDLDARVQNAINRNCKKEEISKLIKWSKELGYRVHVDLCYGLPFQEQGGFSKTIYDVIEMEPDRIAMLTYVHYPTIYGLQRLIPQSSIPNSFMRVMLANLAESIFVDNGYKKIGFDHYVKNDNNLHIEYLSGNVSRDLMGYSVKERRNYLGFGNSAISYINDTYYHNKTDCKEYYSSLDANTLPFENGLMHKLSTDDLIRNDIIQKYILSYFEINKDEINKKYDILFDEYFADEIHKLKTYEKDEMVSLEDSSRVKILKSARYFARHIAHVFDTYYPKY